MHRKCVGATSFLELRTPCRNSRERPIGAHVRVMDTARDDAQSSVDSMPPGSVGKIAGKAAGGRCIVEAVDGVRGSFLPQHLHVLPCAAFKEVPPCLPPPPDELPRRSHKVPCLQVAILEGIVENPAEWVALMAEMAGVCSAPRLRRLFALLLINCPISDAGDLWDKYKEDMADDFRRDRVRRMGLGGAFRYPHPSLCLPTAGGLAAARVSLQGCFSAVFPGGALPSAVRNRR